MPTLYALNMTADLSDSSSGFFDDFVPNGNARAWFQSVNGGAWTAINNGNNNADNNCPALAFSKGTPSLRDQVQFSVFFRNMNASNISSVRIFATFGRLGHANAPNSVASPFTTGSSTRTLLGDEGPHPYPVPPTPPSAYVLGPYTVSVNPGASPGNGRLRFEFSLIASFTMNDGSICEYGYDPEMDVDVGN